MIKYRVCVRVVCYEAWYEFDHAEDAIAFAKTLLQHQVDSEDVKTRAKIQLYIVDVETEKAAESEDE